MIKLSLGVPMVAVLFTVVISYMYLLVPVLLFLRGFVLHGEILLADGCLLLLVCVYFPCDNGLAEDIYKFGAVLSKLEGFLESRKYDLLAVVGDFNVDFAHTMFQKLMNYISSWNMLSWRPQICSSPLSSLLMRVTLVRPTPGWTIFCSLLRLLPRSRMLWSCTLVLTSLTICPCLLY